MDPPYAYRAFGADWTRTGAKRFPAFAICLQAEFARSWMIGRSRALRPTEPSLGLADWHISDASLSPMGQALSIELPRILAIGPIPVAGRVVPFVLKAHGNAVLVTARVAW